MIRTTTPTGIPIDVLLAPEEWAARLRRDAAAGLVASPKELPPTWLYDDAGCELFEAITRLPEYYPTRTEAAILAANAAEIATLSGADTLVELGAGTSEKTRLLLDALEATGRLQRFVPFDVAGPTLAATVEAIAEEYPQIDVHGVVGDFREHVGELPADGRRLIAFLGGTIGNLRPGERARLLGALASSMKPDDSLLLGTDLVKDRDRLIAAYDDSAGVTAAFDRNVLLVLNRQLGANFDVDQFEHVARWDPVEEWIEMRLRSRREQTVDVPGLGLRLEFERGEELRTEISAKFRPQRVVDELAAAGLATRRMWTDEEGDFALTLAAHP
jgi:L-histidine N-alpha-methyltransferase